MAAPRKTVTDARTRRMCEGYSQGRGLVALAGEMGCSPSVVRNVLVENNVSIRGRGRPRKDA